MPLKCTSSYEYLGFAFNENMSFTEGIKALAEWALGSVMNEIKLCPDLGFSTFSKLYDSVVGSVLFHAAGPWGFKDAPDSNAIQGRATRCFLGVHKYPAKWFYWGGRGMGVMSCKAEVWDSEGVEPPARGKADQKDL